MQKKHVFWWTSRPMNEGRDCNLINIKKNSVTGSHCFSGNKSQSDAERAPGLLFIRFEQLKGGNVSYFKPFVAA